MEQIADQIIKKTWTTPDVIIIATCHVESGGAPGFHEGTVTNSVFLGSGNYLFNKTSGGNTIANHPINFYNS